VPSSDLNPGPSGSSSGLTGVLTHLLGTSHALASWATERAPLRVVVVRWSLLVFGLGATLSAWRNPNAPGNLARNGSVTMSSNCDISPEFSPFPAEPARLVDGKRDRVYDACTAKSQGPWAQVDLGARAVLDRVVVVGRAECCWGLYTLPLVLEVSDDGREYREAQRRLLPFTQDDPWIVELGGQTARRVRLRVASPSGRSQIVLTEIEVYGRPIDEK
jgi:hypothetical protein